MYKFGVKLPSNSGGSIFMSLKSSAGCLGGLLSLLGVERRKSEMKMSHP